LSQLENWEHIIKRCRRGEHEAQCEAYRHSWKIIFPSVLRVLRNREEAEDVMQESFIKGFERLVELKENVKFVAWLKQIALRNALNKLRSIKSSESFFEDGVSLELADEEETNLEFDIPTIHRKIEEMPAGYRLVVQFALLEDLTHEEIGKLLGITASTSRSQYSRAMSKLRKELLETHE
jgi:RNA polymerase sigma factor (sigma-70 family)